MDKCNDCKYEYDGICKVAGQRCDTMVSCDITENKLKEEMLKMPTIRKDETEMENKHDNINPDHYKERTSIECIDAMIMTFGAKRTSEYCVQNAYKYVWRHKYKNGLEDLKKAEWYINKFDELVTWCETSFIANGTVKKEYIELGQFLRKLIERARKEYEKE